MIEESEPKVISEGLDYQWKLYYIKDVQQDQSAQGQEQAKPVVPMWQPIFDEKKFSTSEMKWVKVYRVICKIQPKNLSYFFHFHIAIPLSYLTNFAQQRKTQQ